MCVEALQTLQKETDALADAERALLDTQDCLDKQRDDLKLDKIKAEVDISSLSRTNLIRFYCVLECEAPTPSCARESRTCQADHRGQARIEP